MKRNVKSHSIFIWAGHLFYSVELHISFCRLSLSPNVINLNVKLYSIFQTNIRIEHMLDRERERERERERREEERERQRIIYLQGCSLCLSLSPSLCLFVSLSLSVSLSLCFSLFLVYRSLFSLWLPVPLCDSVSVSLCLPSLRVTVSHCLFHLLIENALSCWNVCTKCFLFITGCLEGFVKVDDSCVGKFVIVCYISDILFVI